MKNLLTILTLCLALIAATDVLAKSKKSSKVVDCDAITDDQHQLQKALNKAKRGSVIKVKGTCVDIALVITSAGITLEGEGSDVTTLEGNGSENVIWIQGADQATIQGMEVNSGLAGLSVSSALVYLNDVVATGNEIGFLAVAGARINCDGCSGNGNDFFGAAIYTALVLCGNTSFNANGLDGAFSSAGGLIYSRGDQCVNLPELEFNNNGRAGLLAFSNGSVDLFDTTFTASNNTLGGIVNVDSSSINITGSSVTLNSNSLAVLTFSGSTTHLNDDPTIMPIFTNGGGAFTDDYSNFYSGGDFPSAQIFCGPDGGGEVCTLVP